MNMQDDTFELGGKIFTSRLLVGTGKFPGPQFVTDVIKASGTELITVAMRRVNLDSQEYNILSYIPKNVTIMTNTSGARNAKEAVRIARIAREAGCGNFIKIEVINEMKYLMPDNEETIKATEELAKDNFVVLPYCGADPVVAKKLADAGAAAVMPLGSPIGSNKGIKTKDFIEMIIEYSPIPVIVDAGIGKPSHASEAMEMGASAVLINTAIATAEDPVLISKAFALAVQAGRYSYLAKARGSQDKASASSPLTGFLREDR
ncbi:MAG: thiazole synthase [Elusimicrobia bacterium]|nr:thiazole synthase [Elusimicrobiota bacterium]MBU2614959.1 thiazole synthase [Elusimicrobiota bacterium]